MKWHFLVNSSWPIITITDRCTDFNRDDVFPACETTLKNLQLEYLDLYLIHSPVQLRKGSNILKLVDEDKLGYDPSVIAKCWEVRDIVCYMYVCECTYGNTMHTHTHTGHGGAHIKGAGEGHWYLQLYNHENRTSASDSQDCTSYEPGRVPSLSPAAQIERVPWFQRWVNQYYSHTKSA